MFKQITSAYARWNSRPPPGLLLFVTLVVAFVAAILLIAAVNDSAILYKEF